MTVHAYDSLRVSTIMYVAGSEKVQMQTNIAFNSKQLANRKLPRNELSRGKGFEKILATFHESAESRVAERPNGVQVIGQGAAESSDESECEEYANELDMEFERLNINEDHLERLFMDDDEEVLEEGVINPMV